MYMRFCCGLSLLMVSWLENRAGMMASTPKRSWKKQMDEIVNFDPIINPIYRV